MPTLESIITQAELVLLPGEVVYERLKAIAATAKRTKTISVAAKRRRRDLQLDPKGEFALLDRNDLLIDLGLAQYCIHIETAGQIFAKTVSDTSSVHEQALRLAILSNTAIGDAGIPELPVGLFSGSTEKTCQWMSTAPILELETLFTNPSICTSFLENFLRGRKEWNSLSEDRQQMSLMFLCKNPSMQAQHSDFERLHQYVWALTATLPTTVAWADVLNFSLEKLPLNWIGLDDPLGIAQRWQTSTGDFESQELGRLSDHAGIRKLLGKAYLRKTYKPKINLLTSEDCAFRAAAYEYLPLSPEQIAEAFAKDGVLAVESCSENPEIWRKSSTRDVLIEVGHEASRVHDWHRNFLHYQIDKYQQSNPEWFTDEEEKSAAAAKEPATKGDAERIYEAVEENKSLIRWLVNVAGPSGHLKPHLPMRLDWAIAFALGILANYLVN
jgi:hypothetical protein